MQEKLHPYHIAILTYMIQSGVVLISLPSQLASSFGTNGWIAVFLYSLIASFNIYLISLVYRLGKGRSILQIMEGSLPKFMVYPIYAFLVVLWALLGCLVAKQFVLILQLISFPTTNPMIVKILLDVLVYFLVIKGIYNITKASTLFFYVTVWMVFMLSYQFSEFEWARLTTFIFQGGQNRLLGGIDAFTAFLGYELFLLFFPYIDPKTKWVKAVYIGNLYTTFVYFLVSFISFGFFSFEQLKSMKLPLLDAFAYIELPFVERMENLMFAFLMLKILITTVLYFWAAQEIIVRIVPQVKTKAISFILVLITYFISFLPTLLREVKEWLKILARVEIVVAFSLPVFLIILLLIGKKKEGKHHA